LRIGRGIADRNLFFSIRYRPTFRQPVAPI
jgi:hypothetical protein